MIRRKTWTALALSLLLGLPAAAQQAERQAMFEKVGPSVVAIRNSEGYGSGFVLDEQGTILTNAHVIVSPMPHRIEAMVKAKEGLRPAFFSKAVLLGVHPSHDLALIRVDPSENQGRLVPLPISKSRAVTGDLIFALGYPNTHGGSMKVCTSGEVKAVDQFVDMPGYFEISAEIHHGNSGGPIVDKFGNAMGVVTLGKFGPKPTGWAVPLHDFRPDQFIPLDRRPKDPSKASKLLREAEDLLKMGGFGAVCSEDLFQMAMLEDISNPDTYFKIGMIQRAVKRYPTAAAYLMRSIQLEPWSSNKDEVYHELGACFYYQRKPDDAMVVWNEAVAKFPVDSARVWDAIAVAQFEGARFLDAACASRASLRGFGDRAAAMNDIYDRSRQRLGVEDIGKLTRFEKSIEDQVKESNKVAEQARKSGKKYMTPGFEKFVQSFQGVQKEAEGFNFSTLGKGSAPLKPLDIPDAELASLFILTRIHVAGEHLHAGNLKLATEVLEDVIKMHPDRPETDAARDMLRLINKKK